MYKNGSVKLETRLSQREKVNSKISMTTKSLSIFGSGATKNSIEDDTWICSLLPWI